METDTPRTDEAFGLHFSEGDYLEREPAPEKHSLIVLFIDEWLRDSFYWISGTRLKSIEKIASRCGVLWHTGSAEFPDALRYPHNNVHINDSLIMQSLPFFSQASYGEPKNIQEMEGAWEKVKHLDNQPVR